MSDGLGGRNLSSLDNALYITIICPMTFQSDNEKAFVGDLIKEPIRCEGSSEETAGIERTVQK